MNVNDAARVLSIARHESGFNPDAAAGTTSAAGLGQFVNGTWLEVTPGGTKSGADRWNIDKQAEGLVSYYLRLKAVAARKGLSEENIYALHHDGPGTNGEGPGLRFGRSKIDPFVDRFKNALEATGYVPDVTGSLDFDPIILDDGTVVWPASQSLGAYATLVFRPDGSIVTYGATADAEGRVFASVETGAKGSLGEEGTIHAEGQIEDPNAGPPADAAKFTFKSLLSHLDGGIFGSILGTHLSRQITSDPFARIVVSAALSTALGTLGEAIDERLFGGTSAWDTVQTAQGSIEQSFGESFLADLKAAGIGALSSFLTAELVDALGLEGFEAELASSAGGAVIGQVITNLVDLANGVQFAGDGSRLTAFSNIGAGLFVTAVGSFVGNTKVR